MAWPRGALAALAFAWCAASVAVGKSAPNYSCVAGKCVLDPAGPFSSPAECAANCAPAPPPKPNIILTVIDDLGYHDLGHTNNNEIDTPVLSHLATDGIIMDRMYLQSTCSPTRTALPLTSTTDLPFG